jgi:glycine/sarcosine N-methyltransferase
MSFYEQIAPYYDQIFPAGQEQLEFIKNTAGSPPKRLLDIACGVGLYSVALALEGYEMWATDLDAEMVRQTNIRAAAGGVSVKARMMDMLELDKLESDMLLENKFDCAFCIGNSIVHLGSRDTIFSAVLQMKKRLKESGSLLLQIINFDRVISKGITTLPSIINPEAGLEFHRNYNFDVKTGLISFDTILELDKNGGAEKYLNSIKLFPLVSSVLRDIMERAGLINIEFFGDFRMKQYVETESYMLVVRASV